MQNIRIYLKIAVSYFIYYSGLFKFIKFLKRKKPISLCYHRVVDNFDKEKNCSLTALLVTKDSFLKQIAFLKKQYNIISEDKFIECLKNNRKFLNYSALITFDDGYMDNYISVYPNLKTFNIPATMFLTTDFIDDKVYPGWEKEKNNKKQMMLSWKEIKEMSENGISFGAHTQTHPVYKSDDVKDITYREIETSKKIIEEKINKKIYTFAFPEGRYNTKAIDTAINSKYEALFSLVNKNHINLSYEHKNFITERIPINEGTYRYDNGRFHLPIFACSLIGLWNKNL